MKFRLAFVACLLSAHGQAVAEPAVDYLRDIKPILASKCYSCHGALTRESNLRLDTAAFARRGGESGPAIVPGLASDSLILARVLGSNDETRMPPDGEGEPLTDRQVALLTAWISQGALAPVEPIPPDPRMHWAYQAPVRPAIPVVKNTDWGKYPIDAFVAWQHDKQGLTPVQPAAPKVLVRRLYLDLVGLPPTRDQLSEFLADPSDDAYKTAVNRLLDSPQYGQRWGRHWMDVWRYSDWSGYRDEIRVSQRHIWNWRDWIIESLNGDKGYDQMVIAMLAGDELAPTDPETVRATGFLARNWYKFNRNLWLDETIEHTAKAFLGVTINCARCHNHKFDPISQQSYYQLRAVFEPHDVRTDRVPGATDLLKDGLPRVYDDQLSAATFLFIGGNDKHPDKERPIRPDVPAVLGGELDIQVVNLPVEAFYPAIRQHVRESLTRGARDDLAEAETALAKAHEDRAAAAKLADAAKLRPPPIDNQSLAETLRGAEAALALAELQPAIARASLAAVEARIAADRAKYADPPPANSHELALSAGTAERQLAVLQADLEVCRAEQAVAAARAATATEALEAKTSVADAEKAAAEARKQLATARTALEKPTAEYTSLGKEYPRSSTGRRLALARWIADKRNPLTARVAVNHIWLRHFGAPLVENVFDFGLRTPQPRHAALLDWLSVEFMESGWSMKHLHRLMVTSNVYRLQSSTVGAATANDLIDPDNDFFWRTNSRRLEAEIVRDSILYVAGSLDLTHGGPEIDQNHGQTSRRRSVYFRHAYEKKMKFLELFDGASEIECYRRTESVVPQQALAMSNSALSFEQARLLARQLTKESPPGEQGESGFVTIAFEQILSRAPSSDETAECLQFLAEQSARLADTTKLTASIGPQASVKPASDPHLRARESLIHVLMNHSDFVTTR